MYFGLYFSIYISTIKLLSNKERSLFQLKRKSFIQSAIMSDLSDLKNKNHEQSTSQFQEFIQSNQVYMQEKFHQHFTIAKGKKKEKIKFSSLPIQNLLSYIFQVFSLQRYSQDSKIYQSIKTSVQQNVKQFFIDDPNKLSNSTELTFDGLMKILVFIVKKNSIFSIQYEKKPINVLNQQKNQSPKKQMNFQVDIKLDKDHEDSSIIEDNGNYQNSSSKIKHKKANSFQLSNQFQASFSLESLNLQNASQKLVRKNSKAMFDFYCRQQMQLGGVITFDRLSEETYSMSLGKCLTFAKATKLYSNLITRNDLVSKFKKLSQGKKYINYEKFQAMMGQFQQMDPQFNERVGLLSQDIRKVLKYVKLPFNTKDVQPRQKIAIRNFSSRLTEHSGQTSEELKLQLERMKNKIVNQKKINQIRDYMEWKQNRSQLIRQNDLRSSRLPKKKDLTVQLSFIGSIIHPEEDDETYLKDHLIPRLEKQTEKVQRFGKVFETQRYKSLDKLTLRKQSVVSDIRKRIQEIESSENLSTSMNMQRRLSKSRSPGKKYTQT